MGQAGAAPGPPGRRAQTAGAESVKHLAQRAGDASEATAKRLAEIRAEYGPMAAEKARTAGEAVRHAAAEYGPVAAEKARTAGEAVRHAAAEYGPVAAERPHGRRGGSAGRRGVRAGAEKARTAGEAVRHAAAEYGPVAAEKARTAGEAVRHAAAEYGPDGRREDEGRRPQPRRSTRCGPANGSRRNRRTTGRAVPGGPLHAGQSPPRRRRSSAEVPGSGGCSVRQRKSGHWGQVHGRGRSLNRRKTGASQNEAAAAC